MKRRQFMERAGLAATGMMFMGPSAVLANNAFKREKRKIAVVGTGVRGVAMFGRDIVRNYSDYVQIVGLCDINPGRLKYANGVQLNYLLTGHSDKQGYYLAFDGTRGRLEARVGGVTDNDHIELVFMPTSKFTDRNVQVIKAEHSPGGHWGGDPIMMDKLFKDPDMPDPLGQQAGVRDGVMSILIGIAARQSTKTGLPVNIRDLTDLAPRAKRQPD